VDLFRYIFHERRCIMAERFLTFGPFRLDLLHSCLWREAQPIALRPQALTVLRYLVLHADRLVTKAELFQHVWDGRQVTDTVLRGCIHTIRVALADTATTPQYLENGGPAGVSIPAGAGRPAPAAP
jgi:DNA-binding winged helix-turn-helix (wHTH) protein